jgi:hypothetical protein
MAEDMKVPQAVITRRPMGRPVGAPGDVERQRQVILATVRLLAEAPCGGSIIEIPEPYRVRTK